MTLQQEAYHLLCAMPEENVRLIVELIRKMLPQNVLILDKKPSVSNVEEDEGKRAFRRIERIRLNTAKYFDEDFDIKKEIKEAMEEKYGHFD